MAEKTDLLDIPSFPARFDFVVANNATSKHDEEQLEAYILAAAEAIRARRPRKPVGHTPSDLTPQECFGTRTGRVGTKVY